eukprot:GHVN01097333.1.p1 GENE.GHVN01097333.1~~GHVN01097333.1.p1  ORF type:complete len:368 (+),score=79.97 GHVN01097333.1:32-1135(+)
MLRTSSALRADFTLRLSGRWVLSHSPSILLTSFNPTPTPLNSFTLLVREGTPPSKTLQNPSQLSTVSYHSLSSRTSLLPPWLRDHHPPHSVTARNFLTHPRPTFSSSNDGDGTQPLSTPPHSLEEVAHSSDSSPQSLSDNTLMSSNDGAEKQNWASVITRLVIAAALIHALHDYGVFLHQTEGPSMHPTVLSGGDLLLCDGFRHRVYRYRQKQGLSVPVWLRGCVVLSLNKARDRSICKRVVAVAGDTLAIQNPRGRTSLDPDASLTPSTPPESPHSIVKCLICDEHHTSCMCEVTVVRVPVGCVWVEGDNPRLSYDSRFYGPLNQSLIFATVVATLHPFRQPPELITHSSPYYMSQVIEKIEENGV